MRRSVFGVVWVLLLMAIATVAVAAAAPLETSSTHVSVKPGSGGRHTKFRLSFRIPDATGTSGLLRRTDVLSVSGPGGAGCVSGRTTTLRSARRGALLRLTLSPTPRGAGWCVGTFHGRIVESQTIICERIHACPDIEVAPRTIARFKFRVTRGAGSPGGSPTGTQTNGPTFAGLVSATTCRVLTPQLIPRTLSYVLTWRPATDPVTPSSGIVYQIYMATTPGGEDYSTPTWTSSPGATTYTTPGITGGGPVYFVVRARDAAGLEDGNTVQRQGVNDCA
jgi:hypothetical protein